VRRKTIQRSTKRARKITTVKYSVLSLRRKKNNKQFRFESVKFLLACFFNICFLPKLGQRIYIYIIYIYIYVCNTMYIYYIYIYTYRTHCVESKSKFNLLSRAHKLDVAGRVVGAGRKMHARWGMA
jgi:hypothetical protein